MTDQQGSWGGARPGAGNPEFKPKWKSGKTMVIRVPEAIADEVLAVARQIDEGKAVTLSIDSLDPQEQPQDDAVTQSSEASLKEEIRRLQAVVSLEKQQKEMCQHKLDKAQQNNKELGNLAREARAELERLQSSTDSPDPQEQPQNNAVTQSSIDPATLFNQLRPLLNRLSDRERRAIQQKLEEIVD